MQILIKVAEFTAKEMLKLVAFSGALKAAETLSEYGVAMLLEKFYSEPEVGVVKCTSCDTHAEINWTCESCTQGSCAHDVEQEQKKTPKKSPDRPKRSKDN